MRDSWSILRGIPESRSVPAGSVVSNTVGFGITSVSAYRPQNLPKGFPAEASDLTVETVIELTYLR